MEQKWKTIQNRMSLKEQEFFQKLVEKIHELQQGEGKICAHGILRIAEAIEDYMSNEEL